MTFLNTLNSNTISSLEIRRTTPDFTYPTLRRRSDDFSARDINVPINRLDAQRLGMTMDAYKTYLLEAVKATHMRDGTSMVLELFTRSYLEDQPVAKANSADDSNIGTLLNRVSRPFPRENNVLPMLSRVGSTGNNYTAPATVQFLMALKSRLSLNSGANYYGVGAMADAVGGMDILWILSTSAWTDFLISNEEYIGNADWQGGKGVQGKVQLLYSGENGAKIYRIQDIAVIVLHDDFLPQSSVVATAYNTANTITWFKPSTLTSNEFNFAPALVGGSLTAVSGNFDAANFTADTNLHKSYFMNKYTMMYEEPEQKQVKLKIYEDFRQTFNEAVYYYSEIRGKRCYDNLLYRVHHGGRNQLLTVAEA